VVLDSRGMVQAFEVGANPQLEQQLPLLLEQLAAGEDVAANTLATYQRSSQAYSRMLEAAQRSTLLPKNAVSTRICPASKPRRLRLSPTWHYRDAEKPGNLLVLPSNQDASRILVLDGQRRMLEFDVRGQMTGRYELEVDAPGVTFIRTAVDARGRRYYVGASIEGERAYVFDEAFHRVGTYPPEANAQGTVADATLMDQDRDGELELIVGFSQLAGVHCATLAGTRKWENRQMPDVLSLAGPQRLLVSGRRGDVIPFDQTGRPESAIVVNGRAIFHLFSARFAPQTTAFCGLTFSDAGHLVAVGLSPDLHEVWDYELPDGVFRDPVQFVTSDTWLHAEHGSWVFAGPDGTIHALREDGVTVDKFAYGERIAGLGLLRVAGTAYLLVASPDGIKAWHVTDAGERLGAANHNR
ncbi:MAG: hypothetical protein ACC628_27605, partial [Pirellulaceae bacterium]